MIAYRFHAEALAEYDAAVAWYQQQSESAAWELASAVEHAIERIREFPKTWPLWPPRDDVRRCVVRAHPYTVVYQVIGDEAFIVAVAHQRRRPGYWLARVR